MSDFPRNPVAIVTGASRGIGAAAAIELAHRGYDLCLVAQDEAALRRTAGTIEAAGRRAIVLAGDLADLAFAETIVRLCVEAFGRVDLLVNNAAWRELLTMRQITPESWDRTLRICLTTPAFLARWAAADMERRGARGVIINVSSIMSVHANGVSPAYVAAKGALDALTYELAVLYGSSNIRVVAVNPGAVDTDMGNDSVSPEQARDVERMRAFSEQFIPMRRWATPQEVARTIAMIASDDASYLTGTTVVIDGGWSHQLEPRDLKRLVQPGEFPP